MAQVQIVKNLAYEQELILQLKLLKSKCPTHLKGCKPRAACLLNLDRNVSEKTLIYGQDCNFIANVPLIHCGDRQYQKFNILRRRNEFMVNQGDYVKLALDFCIINTVLITFSLYSLINLWWIHKPKQGPSHWRNEIIKLHFNYVLQYCNKNNITMDVSEINTIIKKKVIPIHYLRLIQQDLYQKNIKPNQEKYKVTIYKMGGRSILYDWTFKSVKNIYDTKLNLDELKECINDIDNDIKIPKQARKILAAWLVLKNEWEFIISMKPTPKCSEKHHYLVPELVECVENLLKYSEETISVLVLKCDGLTKNVACPELIVNELINRHGEIYHGYRLRDLLKIILSAADQWHRNRRLYENKIIIKGDPEGKIAYKDRCDLSKKFDLKPSVPVIPSDQLDIQSFLKVHRKIYGDEKQLELIQLYVQLIHLLVETRGEIYRNFLKRQLKSLKCIEWIEKTLGYALTHCFSGHLRCLFSLITKMQTYEEVTKTNVTKSKIECNDEEIDTFIPKLKAPPSAVIRTAHALKLFHLDDRLDVNGVLSLEELRYELKGFYKFFESPRYRLECDKKKVQRPVFHGQHIKHMKREIKPQNAICLFNNQYAPARINRGSLGVEQTNGFFEQQEFHRGRKGLVLTYIKEAIVFVAYNWRKWKYWNQNATKLNASGMSESIKITLKEIENSLFGLPYARKEIEINGCYVIKDHTQDIQQYVFGLVKKHELEFTSKPVWSANHDVALYHILMSKHNEWKLTKEGLSEIENKFHKMFDQDKLLRKCEQWGFYLHNIVE